MNNQQRLESYYKKLDFPQSVFVGQDGRLTGTWVMGNNYQVKSTYYGGYPHGYLKRIKALFPDKKKVLHLFSGKVDTEIIQGKRVDINPEHQPDYLGNSVEDCEHYGTSMVKRNKVLKECVKVLELKGHLVWLDQVLPMYRKNELETVGYIGMVKSTNHRFRVITFFEKKISK